MRTAILGPTSTFLGLLAIACGPRGDADLTQNGIVVDTLASGRIQIRNTAPLTAPSSWSATEAFRLGSLTGDGPDVFGQILDVELGPRGELYVLDGQAEEVRLFGPDGAHRRTLGKPGEGPGELNRAAGIATDSSGALWVMNWRNARYTAFDPATGEVIREPRRLASFTSFPWGGGFDSGGRMIDIGLSHTGEPVLIRLDERFVPSDTLAMPRLADRYQISFFSDGVRLVSAPEPFAPQPQWAVDPYGVIVVGAGSAYRLDFLGFEGDTARTIEIEREQIAIAPSERDSAMAAFAELAEEFGARPEREPRIGAHKPALLGLAVDDRGRVWVRRPPMDGGSTAWDVVDRTGEVVGTLTLPEISTYASLAVRGERLALVTERAGVPTVVVYRLDTGGS